MNRSRTIAAVRRYTSTSGPFPASSSGAAAPPRQRGPGFIRGGILGFLLGTTLAGGTAYVYLLDDYQASSQSLLSSVEDLQKTTHKLQSQTKKIESVEKDLKIVADRTATKGDLEKLRNELLSVIDSVNISHLELKTNVWDLGQDVKALEKKKLDEILAYETFKLCTIKDWRLGLIHYTFQIAIGIYIIYAIISGQLYLKKTDVVPGSIRVSLRTTKPQQPTTYSYCTSPSTPCVYWTDAEAFISNADSMFITTRVSVQNSSTLPAGCRTGAFGYESLDSSYACTATANLGPKKTYYVAGIENMTINIDHSVRGQFDSPVVLATNDMVGKLIATTGEEVLNFDSNYHATQRASNISGDIFTVKDLLQANNINLDGLSTAAGASSGETLRGSGVVVSLLITYINRDSQISDIRRVSLKYRYLPAIVPNAEFKITEVLRNIDGSATILDRHGIFVSFRQAGVVGEFSFMALLTNVVASLALLKIASTFVDLIMLYVLPRRKIYRDVKYEVAEADELHDQSKYAGREG
ncbi:cytochrome c oxidase subunit 1 [Blyttiomyces sp. JEL0837]|nr:cytochrome c oxidase subunit 1 [Blyttiomyces sp. JEL0837]